MIFILNSNPISLSLKESWLFNMVLQLGLEGGHRFETPLYNLNICFPFVYLKVPNGLRMVCLTLHVRVWDHT